MLSMNFLLSNHRDLKETGKEHGKRENCRREEVTSTEGLRQASV